MKRHILLCAVLVGLFVPAVVFGEEFDEELERDVARAKQEIHLREMQMELQERESEMEFRDQMRQLELHYKKAQMQKQQKGHQPQKQQKASQPHKDRKGHKGCFGMFLVICFVVHILVAIWVYQDIRKRNTGSGIWIVIALLAGLLGALVYAIVRIGDGPKNN